MKRKWKLERFPGAETGYRPFKMRRLGWGPVQAWQPRPRRRYRGRRASPEELKFHDVDVDDAVISAAGEVFNSVNLIAQGVTESQRIGRKCTVRSIGWRFRIDLPASEAATNTIDNIRVIMFLDKQANGATASVTDILEVANYQSFNNLANKGRFRTLMDRNYDLVAQAAGGDGTTEDYGEDVISDTFFKKCNIPIEFNSTAGVIAEIRSNNIGILLISSKGLAGFDSKVRLRFADN